MYDNEDMVTKIFHPDWGISCVIVCENYRTGRLQPSRYLYT